MNSPVFNSQVGRKFKSCDDIVDSNNASLIMTQMSSSYLAAVDEVEQTAQQQSSFAGTDVESASPELSQCKRAKYALPHRNVMNKPRIHSVARRMPFTEDYSRSSNIDQSGLSK